MYPGAETLLKASYFPSTEGSAVPKNAKRFEALQTKDLREADTYVLQAGTVGYAELWLFGNFI